MLPIKFYEMYVCVYVCMCVCIEHDSVHNFDPIEPKFGMEMYLVSDSVRIAFTEKNKIAKFTNSNWLIFNLVKLTTI